MARPTRRLRRALLVLVGVVLFGVVTLVLLLKHRPSFYARFQQQPLHQLQANFKLFCIKRSNVADAIINKDPTFRFTLTDAQINAWLAQEVEVKQRDKLPDMVSELRVRLRKDRLIVAAKVDRGLLASIVRVHLKPEAGGDRVRLKILRTKAGAIPVPLAVVRPVVRAIAGSLPDLIRYEEDTDTVEVQFRQVRGATRPLTIDSLAIGDGTLAVGGRTGY